MMEEYMQEEDREHRSCMCGQHPCRTLETRVSYLAEFED